jgi:ABC-2 type transport system ATP-binding protein
MSEPLPIEVENLRHRYGERTALDGISLSVRRGELFALLGPNGGGKTTLFRILSTLLPATSGEARIFGLPVGTRPDEARRRLGVVFQHPALDPHLSALENLRHHGHLYGISGADLRRRCGEMLERLGVADRARDRAGTLSGGLRRRVEIAKGLLHRPDLLLLDEPSTGLDPGARREFMSLVRSLSQERHMTVALTTHYMEEAERCDRVAVLDAGRLVALDSPAALKARIPGDVVVIEAREPAALAGRLRQRLGVSATQIDGTLRIERGRGHELVREIVEAFPDEVLSVSVGRPTLEDVFVHLTGHRFQGDDAAPGGAGNGAGNGARKADVAVRPG